MDKYYHGPTVDDIKNCDFEEWNKKYVVDMISYFIRKAVMAFTVNPRTSISVPTVLFGYNIYTKDLDWLTKELEEAGFKVTIEKEEEINIDDGTTSMVDGTYIISWGDK